jgi:hypothetical protein
VLSASSDTAWISIGLQGRRRPFGIHRQSAGAELSTDAFAIDGWWLGGQTAPQGVALRIDHKVVEALGGTPIEQGPGIVETGHAICETQAEVIIGFWITFGHSSTEFETGRRRIPWVFFARRHVDAIPFGAQYAGQALRSRFDVFVACIFAIRLTAVATAAACFDDFAGTVAGQWRPGNAGLNGFAIIGLVKTVAPGLLAQPGEARIAIIDTGLASKVLIAGDVSVTDNPAQCGRTAAIDAGLHIAARPLTAAPQARHGANRDVRIGGIILAGAFLNTRSFVQVVVADALYLAISVTDVVQRIGAALGQEEAFL